MPAFDEPVSPMVSLPAANPAVPWPTSGWPTGDPSSGIRAALDGLVAEAFPDSVTADAPSTDRFGASLAFVAVVGGRLVAEQYGPTASQNEQLISWSMGKSVAQALVGILVGADRLDINDRASVVEWADQADARNAITIDHLLRMSSGLHFDEDYVDASTSDCIEMLFGAGKGDTAAYAAALPVDAPPDVAFNYSSGTTNIVCRLLADLVGSGAEFETWMRSSLLDVLGIDARLTLDDAGTWIGSSFLHASARDFAKFGLLYLRDGVWDGERILPEGWVDYARTQRATDDEGRGYGAHWWIWRDPNVFYASGYETQRIIVDPARDLVLVRLGKTPTDLADNVDDWLDQIRLLFPTIGESGADPAGESPGR